MKTASQAALLAVATVCPGLAAASSAGGQRVQVPDPFDLGAATSLYELPAVQLPRPQKAHKAVQKAFGDWKGRAIAHHPRLPRVPDDDPDKVKATERKERLHVLNDDGGMPTRVDMAEEVPSIRCRLGLAAVGSLFLAAAFTIVLAPLPGCPADDASTWQNKVSLLVAFVGLTFSHWAQNCLQDSVLRARFNGLIMPSVPFFFWVSWILQIFVVCGWMWYNKRPGPPKAAYLWSFVPALGEIFALLNLHGCLRYATMPASVVVTGATIVPAMLMLVFAKKLLASFCGDGPRRPERPKALQDIGVGAMASLCLALLMWSVVHRVEQFSLRNNIMTFGYYSLYMVFAVSGPVCQRLLFDYYPTMGIDHMMFTVAGASALANLPLMWPESGFYQVIEFFSRRPDALLFIVMLSATLVMSHFFSTYVIYRHGPVTLAAMAAASEAFDVLLPVYFLGLPLGSFAPHVYAVGLLFSLLFARLSGAMQRQDLDTQLANGKTTV